jgi:hypothetical protein
MVFWRAKEENLVEEADYCISLVSIGGICTKCSCDRTRLRTYRAHFEGRLGLFDGMSKYSGITSGGQAGRIQSVIEGNACATTSSYQSTGK